MSADLWTPRPRAATHCVTALAALGCLAGCAMVYEGKYDWDEGWRVGRVLKFGPGMTVPHTTRDDCREQAPPADVSQTFYAEVAYRNEGRWLRHRIQPVPEGVPIEEGQTVYINVRSCQSGLMKSSTGSRAVRAEPQAFLK